MGLERQQSVFEDQQDFMIACGQRVDNRPSLDNVAGLDLYIKLIEEELSELKAARANNDIVEIADAIIDIVYVTAGAGNSIGLPLDALWEEVHGSNMAKVDPDTGMVKRREDGKILKPEGWKKPDIAGVLQEYGAE